jgi:hypothetical protein
VAFNHSCCRVKKRLRTRITELMPTYKLQLYVQPAFLAPRIHLKEFRFQLLFNQSWLANWGFSGVTDWERVALYEADGTFEAEMVTAIDSNVLFYCLAMLAHLLAKTR